MILILTNQAVFVTLSVITMPPLAQCIFIFMLNQDDVIGDQSDVVTQNAWFRSGLCAAISGEISILVLTRAESWGRFPVPRICRWESRICTTYYPSIFRFVIFGVLEVLCSHIIEKYQYQIKIHLQVNNKFEVSG